MENPKNFEGSGATEGWKDGNPPRKSPMEQEDSYPSVSEIKAENEALRKQRASSGPLEPDNLVSDLDFKDRENFQRILRRISLYESTEMRPPTQIELAEELGCSQSTISNLLRKMRRKGLVDRSMRIIGKIQTPMPMTATRRIPFRLEDGTVSGTDRIPLSNLIGGEDFKFFSWLVEGPTVTPDIIERGVRADDLAIVRVQDQAEPGNVVLVKKADPDPEKAPKLVLEVASPKTQFILGKVVSVMREEPI